jgi:hypothetical protein
MTRLFTRSACLISCLASFLLGYSPAKAVIVDIDAQDPAGTSIVLGPGNYRAMPIGVLNGGMYNAWHQYAPVANSVPGCDASGSNCLIHRGWTNNYSISASIFNIDLPQTNWYATDLIALSEAQSVLFTLISSDLVNFHIVDNPADYGDNVGGISLDVHRINVSNVPLPAAYPLFLVALIGLGLFSLRRRAIREFFRVR